MSTHPEWISPFLSPIPERIPADYISTEDISNVNSKKNHDQIKLMVKLILSLIFQVRNSDQNANQLRIKMIRLFEIIAGLKLSNDPEILDCLEELKTTFYIRFGNDGDVMDFFKKITKIYNETPEKMTDAKVKSVADLILDPFTPQLDAEMIPKEKIQKLEKIASKHDVFPNIQDRLSLLGLKQQITTVNPEEKMTRSLQKSPPVLYKPHIVNILNQALNQDLKLVSPKSRWVDYQIN